MPRWFAANNVYFPTVAISLALVLLTALTLSAKSQAQGPALTTISATVYRADGTAASGAVLISWPSFQTAEGDAVAAGNLSVTIGPLGAFTVQLVPNVGASPAGTYYVAVFQLDDGTVRKEYWAVPATSPTTIAAVLTTPGTGLGNLAVTQQYVDAAVANRAIDATVVHLAGAETVTGTKQFTVPPSLPAPAGANDAANKGYVDAAVSNVGAGAYVAIAGGTMTGPLTLPADPAAPNQAADRHYVDSGLSAKADLVNGTVPPGELGAGVASSATCLAGNSTWGSCGGGAPAGITYATTALNWTQTISSSLTSGSQATVTLTPCPVGIDTSSGAGYQVLLSGGGNSESVSVIATSGGCTSGGASGTITFTPFYSYAGGYTISSASSGIQETINAACGTYSSTNFNNLCNVTIPASGPYSGSGLVWLNNYAVQGTIFLHSNESVLNGYGVQLMCTGRGPCLQTGDLINETHFVNITVKGLSFRQPTNFNSNSAYAGVNITNTAANGTYKTITTAVAHNFRPGDLVTILFTDNQIYWGDAIVYDCGSGSSPGTCTSSSTTFRIAGSQNVASQNTPGVVALAYEAILDNADGTHFVDIQNAQGSTSQFNNFFDIWDDENATIDHFNNNGISLRHSYVWLGSFIFSGGQQNIGHNLAPVITVRDSKITANDSVCVTDYNSNGLYFENTVCQASGPWQVYSSNSTGNYQGAFIKNIYSESSIGQNPPCNPSCPTGATSPFPGLGVAGLIAGPSTGAAWYRIEGTGQVEGQFQTGGSGSTPYSYFIVANDTTAGTQTAPMQVLNWKSTGSDSILVNWPRVANGADTITYDVLRMTTPSGIGGVFPYVGGCTGGPGGACGYVALGLSQAAACSGTLVCTYTDSGSSSTTSYTIKQATYGGNLIFWPGALVSVNRPVTVDVENYPIVAVGMEQSSNIGGTLQIASQCIGGAGATGAGYSTCLASFSAQGNNQTATLLSDFGPNSAGPALDAGRIIFTSTGRSALGPYHIITLIDSNPFLTQATTGYRRAASANDTFIGTDAPPSTAITAGQLSFGAPVSITNYIAQTGDGVHQNWLERLNASLKEFNVPAKFDQSVTLAGLSNGCLNVVSGVIASTGSSCGSGGGGGSVSSVFGRTGVVVASSGDYTVSQVAGAAADAAVVHNSGNETIAGAKTFTSNVTMSGNLLLPQGNGYVPAVGGIGLDTAARLPVVNIGGTTQQVALTSSNISGQAGTALALAAVPTQCSGSFATGIAANGNANCTTPDVIQLPETAQPAGIPNWGVFWFDSATHTPRVIENNGQVIQLALTNLFNSDPGGDPADNLEERNGSTAQNLRVYSSFVNNTTWQRASLGFDTTDNYAVIRSENAASGSAPGLGFWIGSGLKWVVDAAGNLKPWTDNAVNFGSDSGNAAKSIFAKTSFNSVLYGRNDFEIPNDGATGTVLNELAVFNANSPSQAVLASTSSSNGVIGVVQDGAGKSGNAVIAWRGYAYCVFDNTTTAGDAVVASTSTAGDCHDTGSGAQPGSQVIGYVDVTNTTSGQTNGMRVSLQPPQGSGGGNVASVFGRTGVVLAATGDYSVAQVTGAAADSAVVHLAGTETISGAKTFASNVTLTGNLNVAGNINQTGTGPTQWSGVEWTGTTVTVPSGMNFSLGVGSDNTFKCQLSSGASCMPSSGGGMVYPSVGIPNSTGSAWGSSYGTSGTGTTLALTASPVFTGSPTIPGYVPTSTTVNGHALSSNVTVSASDLTTGTLPTAQLPAAACSWITVPTQGGSGNAFAGTNKAIVWGVYNPYPCVTNNVAYVVGTADNTANNYALGLYSGASGGSGTLIATTASTAGTTFAPAAGIKHLTWNTTNISVPAGRIYIALTSNCASSCAALLGTAGTGVTWAANVQVSVTTGGAALPSTVTLPADSFSSGASIPALIVY